MKEDKNYITVNIKNTEILSKDTNEAIVTFEINGKMFKAFSFPDKFIKNEFQKVVFSFIEDEIDEDVFWSENKNKIKKIEVDKNNDLKYYCYGEVVNINPVIIDCGDLFFDYGEISNDSRIIGSYVYFVIARLDINIYV